MHDVAVPLDDLAVGMERLLEVVLLSQDVTAAAARFEMVWLAGNGLLKRLKRWLELVCALMRNADVEPWVGPVLTNTSGLLEGCDGLFVAILLQHRLAEVEVNAGHTSHSRPCRARRCAHPADFDLAAFQAAPRRCIVRFELNDLSPERKGVVVASHGVERGGLAAERRDIVVVHFDRAIEGLESLVVLMGEPQGLGQPSERRNTAWMLGEGVFVGLGRFIEATSLAEGITDACRR